VPVRQTHRSEGPLQGSQLKPGVNKGAKEHVA